MKPLVLVPIAEGFEEIEAVTIIDVLRRAGAEVIVAHLRDRHVVGRSGITVHSDCSLDDDGVLTRQYQMVVLPGGLPNAHILRDDPRVQNLLQRTASSGGVVAAICAAPAALKSAGLLEGKRATSYPGALNGHPEQLLSDEPVVIDGNITTGRGPATAMAFSLSLVRSLFGEKTAVKIAADVLAEN